MFMYGAAWAFSVSYVGVIYGGELFAMLLLPLLAPLSVLKRSMPLRRVLLAYGIIFSGLIVADIYNQNPLNVAVRGWATIMFAAITVWFAVCALRPAPITNVIYFLIATVFINLIFGNEAYRVTGLDLGVAWGDIAANYNLFKVRIVPFLVPLLALSLHWIFQKSRSAGIVLGFASAAFLFSFDARSAGLIIFLATMVGAFFKGIVAMRAQTILMALIGAVAISYIAYIGYVKYSLAGDGLGHNARQLAMAENPYNPMSLIATGRSEWLVASAIISERPILGYGSLAEDEGNHFSYMRAQLTGSENNFNYVSQLRQFSIPTHSVLIASWVWGGLIGVMGSILLLITALRLTISALFERPDARILTAYFAATLLWDIFFSPIASLRLTFPVALGFLIAVLSTTSQSRVRGR